MRFEKRPTTIDEQLDLLSSRGLTISDTDVARRWLETVGYYRLSAYWLPFEMPPPSGETRSKIFRSGTAFTDITDLYIFDRQLRLLVMEAIERVEIAIRAGWIAAVAEEHGAHAHMRSACFDSGWKHLEMLAQISRRTRDSNEVFVEHYMSKYSEPFLPPLWAITELLTLGELSKWVEATRPYRILDVLARQIGLPTRETLTGTLHVLAYTRNICAHHGRLWNRAMVKRLPMIKRFRSDLVIIPGANQVSNRLHNVLVVLIHLMRAQSAETTYPARLHRLIESRSDRQLSAMGFPDDWRERDIWRFDC